MEGVTNDCYCLFSTDFSTDSMWAKLLLSLGTAIDPPGSVNGFYRVTFADSGTPQNKHSSLRHRREAQAVELAGRLDE